MAVKKLSRPDNSGGWFIIRYSDGQHTHRMKQHVQPFDTTGPTYTYKTAIAGGDTDVQATFSSLVNLVRPFYNNAWSFVLDSIYQNKGVDPTDASRNIFQEVFNWTRPLAAAGSGASATTANQAAGMMVYNMNTTQGGRGRVVLIGSFDWTVNNVADVNPGDAGPAGALIGYLMGATTGIVGHDGNPFRGAAHMTQPYNRRLRRKYEQA
jgi:hypothetical protein